MPLRMMAAGSSGRLSAISVAPGSRSCRLSSARWRGRTRTVLEEGGADGPGRVLVAEPLVVVRGVRRSRRRGGRSAGRAAGAGAPGVVYGPPATAGGLQRVVDVAGAVSGMRGEGAGCAQEFHVGRRGEHWHVWCRRCGECLAWHFLRGVAEASAAASWHVCWGRGGEGGGWVSVSMWR